MTDVNVAPNPGSPAAVPTLSLLGGGLKGTSVPPRLFPGDLAAFKGSKPYEWLPWYGIILSPNSHMVKYYRNQSKKFWSSTLGVKPSRQSSGPTDEKSSRIPVGANKSSTVPLGAKGTSGVEIPEGLRLNNEEEDGDDITISEEGVTDPIYVHWTHTHRVATVSRDEIALVDRNLLKGQRVKNEDGIEGTVVNATSKATIQVLNTNHIIDNVPVQHLNPISPFVHGREIQYKGWIGIITKVRRHVTCRLDNGGFIFSLKSQEADSFIKKDPFWGLGMPCPGMRNTFAPQVMKRATFAAPMMRFIHRWVRPLSFFYTRSSATTIGVETFSVHVMWIQRCPTSSADSESVPPPEVLEKEALRVARPLGLPSHETFGLNSIRMYGIKEDDAITSYSYWYAGFQAKFFGGPATSFAKLLLTPSSLKNLLAESVYEVPVKVIFRQTEVEVEWDNGISEHMLGARVPSLLLPSDPESDYQTGFIVASTLDKEEDSNKYGIILCHDREPGKIRVRWIVGAEKEQDVVGLGETKCGISDLKPHPSVATYHRGLTVFLKDHPQGYEAGTVVDLDLRTGKLLVAIPESRELISVYPHLMTPVAKRCYWNFHTRDWVLETVDLLPGKVTKDEALDEESEVEEVVEMEEMESDEKEEESVEKEEELPENAEKEQQTISTEAEKAVGPDMDDEKLDLPQIGSSVLVVTGGELTESKSSMQTSEEGQAETETPSTTSESESLILFPQEEKEVEIEPIGLN